MYKNPYTVEPSIKPQQAIRFALCNGLIEKYEVNEGAIADYLDYKSNLPIWILEAACGINKEDYRIPIIYQNIWLCLDNGTLSRIQPSGKKFITKVKFATCYVNLDKKLKKLLLEACDSIKFSKAKFSQLCGYRYGNIRTTNDNISITVILKVCQILKINIWSLLENYELFGKTKKEGKIIIPKNQKNSDINVLITWLKTEGHLELRNAHIEINQKNNLKSLIKLRKLIVQLFKLKENKSKLPIGTRGEHRLIISSSPLRQLLCLKYDLPLGYKSGSLQSLALDDLSIEDYQKLMAAFIQTEGSLSYHYTRNKKKKIPRFEFVVKDRSLALDCLNTLKKLGLNPTFREKAMFKVGLYKYKEVIDLVHQTKKYMFNEKKINALRRNCTYGIGL